MVRFASVFTPCVILALTVALGCSRGTRPAVAGADGIPVVFEFDERGPITQGDAVMLRGFEIGRVTAVTLERKVRVDTFLKAQYARLIPVCAYGFASSDWLGTGTIDIVVVDDAAPPLAKGEVLPGVTTTAGRVNIESKLRLARAMQRAGDALTGENVDRGLGQARRLAGEGADAAKRGLDELDEAAQGGVRAGLGRARDELGLAKDVAKDLARDAWHGSKRLAGEALDTATKTIGGSEVLDKAGQLASEGARAVSRGVSSIGVGGAIDTAREKGAALYEEGSNALGDLIDENF